MAMHDLSDVGFSRFHGAGALRRHLRQALDRFRMALRRHAQRRALAEMEPWQLADLGLSRADADAEARRPPWEGAPQQP